MKLVNILLTVFVLTTLIFNTKMIPINEADAWGFDPHRGIAEEAANWLPAPWDTQLKNQRSALREASVLPDLRKSSDPYEGPRHWDNSDMPHQDYNIRGDDPDYKLGVVSWATENATKDLIKAIEQNRSISTLIEYFGVLSHYVADASSPFHATGNYNGQLTGNNGIHSRFESTLANKYLNVLFSNITLGPLKIVDAYNQTESTIASGLVATYTILEADNIAKEDSGGFYDDTYYAILYRETKDILQARITLAVQNTANLWYTALVLAGAIEEDISSEVPVTSDALSTSEPISTSESSTTTETEISDPTSTLPFFIESFIISLLVITIIRRKK